MSALRYRATAFQLAHSLRNATMCGITEVADERPPSFAAPHLPGLATDIENNLSKGDAPDLPGFVVGLGRSAVGSEIDVAAVR
jgi:hypothetical protein